MKPIIAALTLGLAAISPCFAEEPPAEAKTASTKLVEAIVANDAAAFRAPGDETFSKALTDEVFAKVQTQVAPRLKAGHEVHYLGEMHRKGNTVTLWKLTYKDGGDDALATLSMKDGKVTGFFIQ